MTRRRKKSSKGENVSVAVESTDNLMVEDLGNQQNVKSKEKPARTNRRKRKRHEEEPSDKQEEKQVKEPVNNFNPFDGITMGNEPEFTAFGSIDISSNSSNDSLDDEEKAVENNATIAVLDLFNVDHNRNKMEVVHSVEPVVDVEEDIVEKDIAEEEPEKEPEEFQIKEDSVLGSLKKASEHVIDRITHRLAIANGVQIHYDNTKVPSVIEKADALLLANYRVYIRSKKYDWDELFEVKQHKGEFFEIETGVSLDIPDGYDLELSISDRNMEKYAVVFEPVRLTNVEAARPIIVKVKAAEGGYLSRIGRMIECRLLKREDQ